MRAKRPDAVIDFAVNEELQVLLDNAIRPIDDRYAREEWGWEPTYDVDAMVDDFLVELSEHPQKYA